MKHSTLLVLVVVLVASCSKPTDSTGGTGPQRPSTSTASAEYPRVVIDEQHQIRGSDAPHVYQIAAAAGIRLDATQFHFTYGTNTATPNMVQLVGDSSVYRLSRPTETNLYVIDHTTVETVRGEAFRGFRSGDHMMFAIGRSTKGPDKEDFWVSWAGHLEVK